MQTHRHNGTRLKPSTLHGERLVAAYACEVIDGVIVIFDRSAMSAPDRSRTRSSGCCQTLRARSAAWAASR